MCVCVWAKNVWYEVVVIKQIEIWVILSDHYSVFLWTSAAVRSANYRVSSVGFWFVKTLLGRSKTKTYSCAARIFVTVGGSKTRGANMCQFAITRVLRVKSSFGTVIAAQKTNAIWSVTGGKNNTRGGGTSVIFIFIISLLCTKIWQLCTC